MTTEQPPRWQTLLAELKRRRVFRVMAVYGVVGFVVLQVVDLLVPVLLLPDWTYRLVGVLLLCGFPIAIALAWVFERTPEGVRRTDAAEPAELTAIVAAPRRQRWPAGVAALFGLVLVVGGGWLALGGRSGADGGWLPFGRGDRPDSAAAMPSIAVLPFANLARSEETEPFVDGVHDDLLTQLSKIASLRVISRTSVQDYRSTTKNVRQIAGELGVDHVLEGGVQRSGDAVRINVQLIDARSDEHLWAETYNRTLTVGNVFAIQSEIAQSIARALRAELSPSEAAGLAARPTEDLAAYDHYQRGLAFFRRTLVSSDVRSAVREFEAAVASDPEFADAWARLSIARLTLSWDFGRTEEAAAAEEAVRRAGALAPEALLTHIARAYFHYYARRDYDAALEAFGNAEALSPGDPEVLLPEGWVLRRQGRWEEALGRYRAAFARDPRNWDNVSASLGQSLVVLRRYDEAERNLELAISIAPELASSYSHLALVQLMQGDTTAAADAIERGAQRSGLARLMFDLPAVTRILAGRYVHALRATTSEAATDSSGYRNTSWLGQDLTLPAFFLQKAQMLRAVGDAGAARAHFDSARAVLEPMAAQVPPDVIWSEQGSLHTGLGMAFAALGRREEAIRYGREGLAAVERVGDAMTAPLRRADLADIYVTVGEYDLAIDELERLLAGPAMVSAATLRLDPLWAPLRSHPRFRALLAIAER